MHSLSHALAGLIVGILFFFNREILLRDYILFIILSTFMDLDHIVSLFRNKSKYHLRTSIQEPFAVFFVGIPFGYVLFWLFGDFIYFWLCILLYIVHVGLDYLCIFEAFPLAPFSTKIIKHEGQGFIFPVVSEWKERKKEFPKTIDEKYVIYVLLGILGLTILIRYFFSPFV